MPFSKENWSPEDAMKAYLHALQLRKQCAASTMEPKSMELVAALAAGRRSKLMVEIITSSPTGITPLTMALAVAAKQTGGRVVLYTPNIIRRDGLKSEIEARFEAMELGDVGVDLVFGGDLGLKEYKGVDFVVVDGDVEVLGLVDVNPSGSMVVGYNNLGKKKGKGSCFGEGLGRNCYFVSLPIGDGGMEVARIGGCCGNLPLGVGRKYKRFHVTFE